MHLVNCNLRGADVTEACRASALWKVFEGGDQGRKVKCNRCNGVWQIIRLFGYPPACNTLVQ